MTQKNRKQNLLADAVTVLLVSASICFYAQDKLAFLFLGNQPIEMSFRRATAVDPENADFFFGLGILRERLASQIEDPVRQKQRYLDALNALEGAVRMNPYQLGYRITYSDLALNAGFSELGEKIFDVGALPGDFEFHLAHAFYKFKRALRTQSVDERRELLAQGAYLYQKARAITEFSDVIAKHKLKTFPENTQSELIQTLSISS